MTESWLELSIIVFIMGGIAWTVFRGGQANPEGTGALARKLSKLSTEIGGVKTDVAAVKSELTRVDQRVTEIDRRGATTDDIRRIEGKLEEHGRCLAQLDNELAQTREQMAAQHSDVEHIKRQVDRLYDFIVQRGIEK